VIQSIKGKAISAWPSSTRPGGGLTCALAQSASFAGAKCTSICRGLAEYLNLVPRLQGTRALQSATTKEKKMTVSEKKTPDTVLLYLEEKLSQATTLSFLCVSGWVLLPLGADVVEGQRAQAAAERGAGLPTRKHPDGGASPAAFDWQRHDAKQSQSVKAGRPFSLPSIRLSEQHPFHSVRHTEDTHSSELAHQAGSPFSSILPLGSYLERPRQDCPARRLCPSAARAHSPSDHRRPRRRLFYPYPCSSAV